MGDERTELGGLVRVIRTVEEVRSEEWERRKKLNRLVDGLRACPECGGRAKGVIFGAKGRGVWIGCDKTKRCARHICIHTEGWSFEEVCEEWNRRNSWPWSWVKWIKVKCERRWGKQARWDKAREKEKERAEEEAERERKRVYGDYRPAKEGLKKRIMKMISNFRHKKDNKTGKVRKNGK